MIGALFLLAIVGLVVWSFTRKPEPSEIEKWRATGLGIDAKERIRTFERTARRVDA